LRVAIAHDWLVRYAGSERCVTEMLAVFPDAPVLTTLVEPARLPDSLRRAEPSFLQRVPGAVRHHEWLLPAMPLAWRLRAPVAGVDVVVSSSHACAKAVRVAPGIPHLCYCHTPMRYAWQFEEERERFPRLLQPVARAGMALFRLWDRRSSKRVTRFVANSSAVAGRIAATYGRDADVIHPPVRTDFFTPGGARDGTFVYVGRFVGYKRPDMVVRAFADLPDLQLVMVGDGPLRPQLEAIATPNVSFAGTIGDEELRGFYRRARAMVYPAVEDFGIAMAEAQACGTPVIGLAAGGALDIVEHGVTGWLLRDRSIGELRAAIRHAADHELEHSTVARSAQRFSADRFRREIGAAVQALVEEVA
jgi:glycosyltransferase involved in cell wall biosynthesis